MKNTTLADREPLSKAECARLAALERKIKAGIKTFREVGESLAEILEQRLYRGAYASFAEYLEQRWDIGKSHGYRLIAAAAAAEAVSPVGDIQPTSERQLRELAGLPPEEQRKVWGEATAGGAPPTADRLRELIDKGRGGQRPAESLAGLDTSSKLRRVGEAERREIRQASRGEDADRRRQLQHLATRRLARIHAGLVEAAEDLDLFLDVYLRRAETDEPTEEQLMTLAVLRQAARDYLDAGAGEGEAGRRAA